MTLNPIKIFGGSGNERVSGNYLIEYRKPDLGFHGNDSDATGF